MFNAILDVLPYESKVIRENEEKLYEGISILVQI